jgi:hypothetical protein
MSKTAKRLTVTDHEDARSEIIAAFAAADVLASKEETWDTVEAEKADNHAFNVATKYGWHYEDDEGFMGYALKATQREILAEGLVRSLKGIDRDTLLRLKADS